MTLEALIGDPARKARLIDDCVQAVEDEVKSKGGLSGMALKAGYAAFQKIRPGMTRAAVVRFLPPMIPILDRTWVTASASGSTPEAWYSSHRDHVADQLLKVTDDAADRSHHAVLVRLYRSLRGSARDHVAAGVPRLAGLLRTHLG